MPRIARSVFPGVPHHVTQRGNRQGDVFNTDDDRRQYLQWLGHYSVMHQVEILAYCLMTNHIHLVLIPSTRASLQKMMKPLHGRYAQWFNHKWEMNGRLWQGRYYSSPLDDRHALIAMRYVELNPVRAGLADKAEAYVWSSARAHCELCNDGLLAASAVWSKKIAAMGCWKSWLSQEEDQDEVELLRYNTRKGLPSGSKAFIKSLEQFAGRPLTPRPPGRPKRKIGNVPNFK